MDEISQIGVGRRVRAVRKLAGWTQEQLAQRSHVSTSLVKAVEQGRVPASPAFVAASARALNVSVPDLYADSTPRFGRERAGVADLETAVIAGPALISDEPPSPVDELAGRVDDIAVDQRHGRYDRSSRALPTLIEDLNGALGVPPEQVNHLLARTYGCATICLHRLGSALSGMAAERAAHAARLSGDPLLAATADIEVGLALLHRGSYAVADRLASNARDMISGLPGDASTLSVRGYAHLRSAITAARAGDATASDAHIDEATRCAEHVPDGADLYDTAFNAANVVMHAVAAAVELGEGGVALTLDSPVTATAMPSRRAHHHIDLARASLLQGRRDRALVELHEAREAAPQLTRYHPQVAETLRVMAETDRRRSDTLAGFASWVGLRL